MCSRSPARAWGSSGTWADGSASDGDCWPSGTSWSQFAPYAADGGGWATLAAFEAAGLLFNDSTTFCGVNALFGRNPYADDAGRPAPTEADEATSIHDDTRRPAQSISSGSTARPRAVSTTINPGTPQMSSGRK